MDLTVAVAVIYGADGRILISQRAADRPQGLLWEFPGGKLESGESAQAALRRELLEELGIKVRSAQAFFKVRHQYPEQSVVLNVWKVTDFDGTPRGVEGQPLAWVTLKELTNYAFPAANTPIINALRLPEQYLITPAHLSHVQVVRGVTQALQEGVRLLQLRAPDLFDPQYRELAADVQGLCAGKAQLMLKGPLEWLGDFPAAGWHLTAAQLRHYASLGRPFPAERWLAVSCHTREELDLAAQIQADFVTLSPVCATTSHPEVPPLGWTQVRAWLTSVRQPVYLLGGMQPSDLEQAQQFGAQGVAGISNFWPETC